MLWPILPPPYENMKFDEILTQLGAFGPYQRRTYFLLCLISIPGAWHKLVQVFFAGKSDYWCSSAPPTAVESAGNGINCTYLDLAATGNNSKDCGVIWRNGYNGVRYDEGLVFESTCNLVQLCG